MQRSPKIIKASINVHKELGPGLLESVYQSCMIIELKIMEIRVDSEVPVPVEYRGNEITDQGFRIDLLVEDQIIVELKSVSSPQPCHGGKMCRKRQEIG